MDLPAKLLITAILIFSISSMPKREALKLMPESLADAFIYTQIFSFAAMVALVLYMIWA